MRKHILIAAAALFLSTSAHAGLSTVDAPPTATDVAPAPPAPQAQVQQLAAPTQAIDGRYVQQPAPPQLQQGQPQQPQLTPEQQAAQQQAMRQQQMMQQKMMAQKMRQQKMMQQKMMQEQMARNMTPEQKLAYEVHEVKEKVKMKLIEVLLR